MTKRTTPQARSVAMLETAQVTLQASVLFVQGGDADAAFRNLDDLDDVIAEARAALVAQLRAEGWSWQRVADLVGLASRQAAQQRYGN